MKQSMLAVLALMILTMVALNQQQSTTHSVNQMMRSELTTIAAAKLAERLDLLGGLPFDELDDLPASEAITVTTMGSTLTFEVQSEVRVVDVDASGQVVAAGGATDYREVTLWIHGPTDGAGSVALPRDVDGRGRVTMQRIYSRLGNG